MMAIRASFGLAVSYYLAVSLLHRREMFGVRVFAGVFLLAYGRLPAIATSFCSAGKIGCINLGFLQSGLTCGCVIGPLLGGTLATVFYAFLLLCS